MASLLSDVTFADQKNPPPAGLTELEPLRDVAGPRHDRSAKPWILIVEDNPGDVFIMEEALREHNVDCAVTILSNGEEAIYFFDRLELDSTETYPNLVLLDLNLPKVSGHSVLSRIRASLRCPSLPVVMVSSSEAQADLFENRRLGATAYFRKPSNLEDFMKLGALVNSLLPA